MDTGFARQFDLQLPADAPGDGLRMVEHVVSQGRILRRLASGVLGSFKGQRIDFVITLDGRLVVGRGHSVLSTARPVLFAGELKFDNNGDIVEITNNSGHYKIPGGLTAKARDFLQSIGVDVSKTDVREFGPD